MHEWICIIKTACSGSPNAIRRGVLLVNLAGIPYCWLCVHQKLKALFQVLFHNRVQRLQILLKISEEVESWHSAFLDSFYIAYVHGCQKFRLKRQIYLFMFVNVGGVWCLAENRHNLRQMNHHVWRKILTCCKKQTYCIWDWVNVLKILQEYARFKAHVNKLCFSNRL